MVLIQMINNDSLTLTYASDITIWLILRRFFDTIIDVDYRFHAFAYIPDHHRFIHCSNLSPLSWSLREHDRHLMWTTCFVLVHSWSLNSYPHCMNCAGMQSHGSVVKLLKEVCLAACSITDNEVYSFINTSSWVASSTFVLWVLTSVIAFDLGSWV